MSKVKYKISSIKVKNFKCFDDSKFYEFNILEDRSPILLSGPNGFGKTSFYDAIELILSNSITRYNRDIERQNTNLKGNILLNDKTKDGYIVMCLVSDSNDGMERGLCNRKYLTIGAKISKDIKNIDIAGTIEYKWTFEEINTEELDKWIYDDGNWNDDFNPDILSYNKENFNLLYYISQAESTHFLNTPVNKRKDEIDTLLDINWATQRKEFLTDLSSKRSSNLITKKINDINSKMDIEKDKYKEIKNKINDFYFSDIEYESLGLLEKDEEFFSWDRESIEGEFLDKNIRNLQTLIKFIENYDSFELYSFNKEIESINDKDIENYLSSYEFIENGKLQNDKMKSHVEANNRIVELYNRSQFIRDSSNLELYDKNDIESLKGLLKDIDTDVLDKIIQLAEKIKNCKKNLSNDEKAINKLVEARKKLKKISEQFWDYNYKRCPYCYTEFDSYEELNKKFSEVESILENNMTDNQEVISDYDKKLNELIDPVRVEVNRYVGNIDELKINYIKKHNDKLKSIFNDKGLLSAINKIAGYLGDEIDDSYKDVTSIRTLLDNKKKKIENEEFSRLNEEHNFEDFYSKNKVNIEYVRENTEIDKLHNKLSYIKKLYNENKNRELIDSKKKIRKLLTKRLKYEDIRDKLSDIKYIYDKEIKSFKEGIISNLSIPLLIYTGKLLQEYQSGLGVFIDDEEFRFISNGETKHDILNTFSSGQTSAFVISFMLAMNKLYVGDDDQLGFLLIDDPVQTMDDINMASLVELLRNEFSNKQIILSTHEIDKENYILYKFLKYGQMGQSFNVKDELYSY